MAGYNGLGISRKEIAQEVDNVSNLYTLKSSDVVNGEYRITEEILNKIVLCKTTITEQYIAIFMLDIGVDGDYIIFKNVNDEQENYEQSVEDKNSSKDYAYLEFYGDNYSGDAFIPDIWGHWLEFNHAEAMFIKEGSKWRRVETKGRNRLVEENDPKAQNLYIQQLIGSSIMRLMIQNIRYIELGNDNISFGRTIKPDYDIIFDIGWSNRRFKTLFAQNGDFSGTVKAASPVNPTDLINKEYFETNLPVAGLTKLEDDPIPKLAANLNANNQDISGIAKLAFRFGFAGQLDSDRYIDYNVDKALAYSLSYHMFKAKGENIMRISNLNVNVYKHFYPGVVDTINIGSDGGYFNIIYGKTLRCNVAIEVQNNEVADIGKDLNRFKTVYAKNADFTDGATGSFTSQDGKTVTVTKGIITGIV